MGQELATGGDAPGAEEARGGSTRRPSGRPRPGAARQPPAARPRRVIVSRSDPRDEKLALYLAEVERQDKYLRQRNKYRFHIIPGWQLPLPGKGGVRGPEPAPGATGTDGALYR